MKIGVGKSDGIRHEIFWEIQNKKVISYFGLCKNIFFVILTSILKSSNNIRDPHRVRLSYSQTVSAQNPEIIYQTV